MLKFPCLVLDHDETVVQTEQNMGYPFFCQVLQKIRPGVSISLSDYVYDCYHIGFTDMCRSRFQFTPEELQTEHEEWNEYIRTHTPDPYPGIDRIIKRQKEAGGLVCVVSHSSTGTITRDYMTHFGIRPDAIYGWDLPPEKRKPSPYPLLDIMERFRLQPEDLLVVDDAKLACAMAAPLGVKVAFPAWSKLEQSDITREMTALCDFTFQTPEQLEHFLFPTD